MIERQLKSSLASFDKEKETIIQAYEDAAKQNGSESSIAPHLTRQAKKDERKKDIIKNYSCKKNPYENGRMLAQDGTILSFTDLKKAQWYVSKGLATVTCENPFTIMLNFEPSGRSM